MPEPYGSVFGSGKDGVTVTAEAASNYFTPTVSAGLAYEIAKMFA
jgi:hypothetical protein